MDIHNVLWVNISNLDVSVPSYALFSEECNSHLNIAKKKEFCYKTLAIRLLYFCCKSSVATV